MTLPPCSNPVKLPAVGRDTTLADFSAIWALATPVEKQQVLRLMLKEARVDGEQIVDIHWYRPFDNLLRPGPEAETRSGKSLQAERKAAR